MINATNAPVPTRMIYFFRLLCHFSKFSIQPLFYFPRTVKAHQKRYNLAADTTQRDIMTSVTNKKVHQLWSLVLSPSFLMTGV